MYKSCSCLFFYSFCTLLAKKLLFKSIKHIKNNIYISSLISAKKKIKKKGYYGGTNNVTTQYFKIKQNHIMVLNYSIRKEGK